LDDHVLELLMCAWDEDAGSLIEHLYSRASHEGLDQHHLALVSGRILAELAAGVELKALDQPLEVRVIDATPQVCEILEDLSARQIGIEGRLTGHIADETLDLQRLLPAIEPGDSRRAGAGVQQGHPQADGRRL